VIGSAIAAVRRVLQRVVVPVESTEEMNDVWRLYRLARQSDSVRPVVLDALACEAARR
jgi:hypothetical protein